MTDNPDTTTPFPDGDAGRQSSTPSLIPTSEQLELEEYLRNNPRPERKLSNPEIRRFRWTLDGPLETSITIGRGRRFDPDEIREPYYQGVDEHGKPIWHPFSQIPLVDGDSNRLSSLKLRVDPLDDWDYFWMENHDRHTEPDLDIYDPADVLYGPIPDPVLAEEYGGGDRHLLKCCGGQNRPLGKGTNVVIVPAPRAEFVTVHDFVSVVHPYLLARRDDIIDGMNEDPGRFGKPFRSEIKLFVDWCGGSSVDMKDEADWMRNHGHPRKMPPGPLPPHVLKVMRDMRECREAEKAAAARRKANGVEE